MKIVVYLLVLLTTVMRTIVMFVLIFYPYIKCEFVGVVIGNNTITLSVSTIPECIYVTKLEIGYIISCIPID